MHKPTSSDLVAKTFSPWNAELGFKLHLVYCFPRAFLCYICGS